MILSSPYHFKPLQSQSDPRIAEYVNRYIITEYAYVRDRQSLKVKNFTDDNAVLRPVVLYGASEIEKDVPAFHHPYISTQYNWIAFDARALLRPGAPGEPAQPRNASEYAFGCTRFVLTGLWATGKQQSMYTPRLPHMAYAEWLSTNLARKFGLNITEQIKLFALSALYYRWQFIEQWSEEETAKIKLRLQGEIFVESIIDDVIAAAGDLSSVEDFCTACHRVTQSPRLQGFTLGVLMNVLSNNWFAAQGQELVSLSLVHPPTWISLVDASLTSKTYRNSYIARVVEGKNKKGAGDDFRKALTPLIRAQLGD